MSYFKRDELAVGVHGNDIECHPGHCVGGETGAETLLCHVQAGSLTENGISLIADTL
jgi:hypothetical protein